MPSDSISIMEGLIDKFQRGELIGIKSQKLSDPYLQYQYEKIPTSLSTTEWTQIPWYDSYTKESIENIYQNFYKYMREVHGNVK